jgi:hypothetical protein
MTPFPFDMKRSISRTSALSFGSIYASLVMMMMMEI